MLIKKKKLLIVLIIVVCVRDAGHAGLCTLVNENRNVIQSRDGVRRAERERERETKMERDMWPLGDYTSMGVTLHAKYHFHWRYLFVLKIWCTIWT